MVPDMIPDDTVCRRHQKSPQWGRGWVAGESSWANRVRVVFWQWKVMIHNKVLSIVEGAVEAFSCWQRYLVNTLDAWVLFLLVYMTNSRASWPFFALVDSSQWLRYGRQQTATIDREIVVGGWKSLLAENTVTTTIYCKDTKAHV